MPVVAATKDQIPLLAWVPWEYLSFWLIGVAVGEAFYALGWLSTWWAVVVGIIGVALLAASVVRYSRAPRVLSEEEKAATKHEWATL